MATLDEQGYKGFAISGWYGLMAPRIHRNRLSRAQ
jgi:hypothetical protein